MFNCVYWLSLSPIAEGHGFDRCAEAKIGTFPCSLIQSDHSLTRFASALPGLHPLVGHQDLIYILAGNAQVGNLCRIFHRRDPLRAGDWDQMVTLSQQKQASGTWARLAS